MKRGSTYLNLLLRLGLVVFLLFRLGLNIGNGQDKKRTYASRQEFQGQGLLGLLPGTIANAGNAVDKNPKTFSTLTVAAGVANQMSATQFLDFGKNIPAGTPVTLKMTVPASTLGLVDNFQIQPYTNLNYGGVLSGWRANQAGEGFQGVDLLNLLSGKGSVEFTIIPTSQFQGIWIKLGSILGLEISMDVYHAYILENAIIACDQKDQAIDILTGVRGKPTSLLSATGTVSNPWNVVDGNHNTFSLMSTGVEVLTEIYHTTIFETPSRTNQVAHILLQNPGGDLLNLNLLNGLTIQPYLRATPIGDPINTSNLFTLRLFPSSNNIYELVFPVSGSFDRIEIKMGGVAGLLNNLRIYEVSRLPEFPILEQEDSSMVGEQNICKGTQAVLLATSTNDATVKWYSHPYGGTSIGEGNEFTTPILDTDTTYYVAASPQGCSTESPRIPIHIHVHSKPGAPLLILSNTQ